MIEEIDYRKLPEGLRGGVKRYIENGIIPGHFLTAVICNDLKESIGYADDINISKMQEIVNFFYWEVPDQCWGSVKNMADWITKKKEKKND